MRKLFSVLLCLFFSACGSPTSPEPDTNVNPGVTQTGNPVGGEVVFLAFSSSEFEETQAESLTRSVVIAGGEEVTEARMVVRNMVFEETEGCPELFFPPFPEVIDLLNIEPSSDGDGEENGVLNGCAPTMRVTFAELLEGEVASDGSERMVGSSLLVRVEGVRSFPIEFRTNQTWTTTFVDPSRWIDPEAFENLIVGFDLDVWFADVDLEDPAYPSEDISGEVIFIVRNSAFPEVLDQMVTNTMNSMGLYLDSDGDRTLDEDEFRNPIPFRQE